MMNMKLLAVVTPLSIYHSYSTRKTFWEEKFTDEEKLFSAVNMRNCGRRNVRKHKDIKGSDKYVTLDISLKFDIRNKMKITSSESKGKLEGSGKGLITSLDFKAKVRPQKYKKCDILRYVNFLYAKSRNFEKARQFALRFFNTKSLTLCVTQFFMEFLKLLEGGWHFYMKKCTLR